MCLAGLRLHTLGKTRWRRGGGKLQQVAATGSWLEQRSAANACLPPRLACRSAGCVACGTSPAITAASLPAYDYAAFTGQAAANDAAPKPLQLIAREGRITPQELQQRWVVGWGGRVSNPDLIHFRYVCQRLPQP